MHALFYGLTLPGILLAAAGQLLVLAVLVRTHRLARAAWPVLLGQVALADFLVLGVLLTLQLVSRHVNHGSHDWRMLVIFAHLSLAALVPALVWRRLLSRSLGRRWLIGPAFVLVTALGLMLPGITTSSSGRPARVTFYRLLLPHLPRELDGLRLLVVGDVHLGRWESPQEVRARLRPIKGIRADAMVFLGDVTCNKPADIKAGVALLEEVSPAVPRFAILGNHDCRVNARLSESEWRKHGFTPLVNTGQRLRLRGSELWIAGVGDPRFGQVALGRALQGAPPHDFILLLSHSPDVIADAQARQADLILSGHTHGGQLCLPLLGPLACNSDLGPPVASGVIPMGQTTLFVTRGLGDGGLPLRIFSRPEIAILELRAR